MKRIKSTHLIALGITIGTALATSTVREAHACIVILTPQHKLAHSRAVFSGKVIKTECKVPYEGADHTELHVTFAVHSWWKGAGTETTAQIYKRAPADCESPSFTDRVMEGEEWWMIYDLPVKGTPYSEFPIGTDCPTSGTIPPPNGPDPHYKDRVQPYVPDSVQLGNPMHVFEVQE